MGKYALEKIVKLVNENGIIPRSHGNTGKKSSKSLTFEEIQKVSHFIANYAEEFGIPQLAAPRGRDSVPPIYIPCDTTKIFVRSKYLSSCEELETPVRSVKYSTFNKICLQCLPHIKIASPRNDVCANCEKYRKAVVDAVAEEEKLEATTNMRDHITSAQKE
ncbi:hypothetical protein KUTeg_000171 [Tegillarca granosa]|uniref:Uncharacterized protein n=1 Tax=Tegillarca granosa TaxID=220873 RepID=A0ABQ9FZL0_TEGGR|nr:hypothetical protein KUTeg_000171 [Tegillarca granosa]